ncbi:MAG: NADH-quinone oxidoreductase subunit NuoK [Sphingobacteriia bacterium]|jgi:NADH-quinone oxidoreductase subunit K|nr:NADH-quinone oxidoreductase subunit NuoK [Sphingobacteriia bacterium]
MAIPSEHFYILSAVLFTIGLFIVFTRKNAIAILMGIEIMLNASALNLVGFGRQDYDKMGGNIFVLFIIVIAAANAAVGLALILQLYHHYRTITLDETTQLKD